MKRTIFEIKKDEAYATGFVPLFENYKYICEGIS